MHGVPKKREGTIESYLFKDAEKNQVYVRQKPGPGCKTAVTHYRTLYEKDGLALLECRLGTGGTPDKGAACKHRLPSLGDGKYGSERRNKVYGESGQLLCSYRIVFNFSTDAGALNYLTGRDFKVARS